MTGEIFIPSVGRRMPTEVEGPFIPSPSTLLGASLSGVEGSANDQLVRRYARPKESP